MHTHAHTHTHTHTHSYICIYTEAESTFPRHPPPRLQVESPWDHRQAPTKHWMRELALPIPNPRVPSPQAHWCRAIRPLRTLQSTPRKLPREIANAIQKNAIQTLQAVSTGCSRPRNTRRSIRRSTCRSTRHHLARSKISSKREGWGGPSTREGGGGVMVHRYPRIRDQIVRGLVVHID